MSGIGFGKTKFAPEENLPERWRYLPQFSVEERDRRWWEIREKMALRDIDALLVWDSQSVQYITHIPANFAIFPLEGEPIVSAYPRPYDKYWHYGVGQNWVKNVRGRQNIPKVIKELGLERGKIGDVGRARKHYRGIAGGTRERRPFGYYKIVEGLPDAEFVDATDILEEVRMVVSPEEVKWFEKAGEITYLMFEALKKTAATPGARECDLYASMYQAAISNGGWPWGIFIDTGPTPLLHGVAGMRNWPTTRPLKKGDLIIEENYGSYGNYMIGIEHSFSLGEPKKEYREIYEVAEECYKSSVKSFRPGATFAEVERAFRSPCEEAGMAYVELGCHMTPVHVYAVLYPPDMFTDWVDKVAPIKLKAGMIIHQNIDMYNPKWKESTIHLGDSFLITDNGPQKMTKVPVEFTII